MNNKSFTLIEMLVAMTMFVLVITATSTIFSLALRSQRQSLAYQELLDQTSYLMEYMSRAIRMAQKDIDGACTGTPKSNYGFSIPCLSFINYHGVCQRFCLVDTRLEERRGVNNPQITDLTSPNLTVSLFDVKDPLYPSSWQQPPTDNNQPLVKISLEIQGRERTKVQIQTSISQRNLDVQR